MGALFGRQDASVRRRIAGSPLPPPTMHALALALLALPLVQACPGPSTPTVAPLETPDADEVRFVLENIIGFDAESEEAQERLAQWDATAIPVIREVALEGAWEQDTHTLLWILEELEPAPSIELITELMQTKVTQSWTKPIWDLALWAKRLDPMRDRAWYTSLKGADAFVATLLAKAPDENHYAQEAIAECAGHFEWRVATPLLTEWLTHDDQEVRRAAAAALTKITGEVQEVEIQPASFPKVDERPALTVRKQAVGHMAVTTWRATDGTWMEAAMTRGFFFGPALKLRPAGESNGTRVELEGSVDEITVWPQAGAEPLLLARVEFPGEDRGELLVGLSTNGTVLWTHDFEPLAFDGFVGATTKATGEPLFILQMDRTLALLSRDGALTQPADQPRFAPTISLHPALPGLGVAADGRRLSRGSVERFWSTADEQGRSMLSAWATELFVTCQALLHLGEDRGLFVVAGNAKDSIPHLIAYDLDQEPVWRAQLSAEVRHLSGLHLGAGREALVAVDAEGHVHVVAPDGTLLAQSPTIHEDLTPGQELPYLFDVQAHQIADDTVRVHIRTTGPDYVVLIDLPALASD